MKKALIFSLFTFLFSLTLTAQVQDHARWVNVFIGTGAVDSLSLSGSNFPGACAPFGLVQLSPDTREYPDDPCSGYEYNDKTILGFSHTHLSGTGCPDLYDFLFMPYSGEIKWKPGSDDGKTPGFRSSYRHETESGRPGYYGVTLDDYKIKAELTASPHCGMHRYTFGERGPQRVIIDLDHSLVRNSPYRFVKILTSHIHVVDDHTVEGFRIISGWAKLRKVYFRAEFSRPFRSHIVKAGNTELPGVAVANHAELRLVLNFDENNPEPLLVKVGISSVSQEGARMNLAAETNGYDFDGMAAKTYEAWNKELSCIDVEGTEQQKRIFYTGLYHLFIQPNNIADVNGDYLDTEFNLRNAPDKQHYSTFSLWDTYRAAHPFYTIVQPERTAGFINSMLRQYRTYGYLPIWQLWGTENYCMIGNHAIPVITDAIRKGMTGFDYGLAWEAVRASSMTDHKNAPFHLLDQYGYFPEDKQSQSVSLGLEIAYNDWCAASLAKQLGKDKDAEYFGKRSLDYRNLFDPGTGFFRAKTSDGAWMTPFDPLGYGGNGGYPFTEGNAWQYLWYVPHDVNGFINLMGGREKFVQKLDTFFTLQARPEDVNGNASGFIGQYAHGNEPSHHIVYLYDYAGEPWKAQYYSAKVMRELYNDQHSGYSGNEDCGQMSAWYLFSAMGFYPVNPANGIYCLGSPQLDRAVIHLSNGKDFSVLVRKKGKENIYIQKMKVNGKEQNRCFLTHSEILSGSVVEFEMGDEPNRNFGLVPPPEE